MKSFGAYWLETVKPFAIGVCFLSAVYGFAKMVKNILLWLSLSESASETTAGVVLGMLGVFTVIADLQCMEERHQRRKDKGPGKGG